MYFCEHCDNMLYMKIESSTDNSSDNDTPEVEEDVNSKNKIVYYCRCCNTQYPELHKENTCIYSINFNTENIKKKSYINKNIYDDITLPYAEGIKCPNADCPSSSKQNIKYIQYDKDDMKYIYICMDCYKNGNPNHIW
jgi:hypothetical protein